MKSLRREKEEILLKAATFVPWYQLPVVINKQI